jgi:all-trans-retinol dehydrogenase (NAD+)
VNNAGVVSGTWLTEVNPKSIQRTFGVNVFGIFWALKAFLPQMLDDNAGHVVTISSASAHNGVPKLVDYSSSKSAAFGAMDALRLELARLGKKGVKTTVVCPFYINTGMFDGAKSKSPLLPILEPEYVADQVIDAVLTERVEVSIPRVVYLSHLMRLLPVGLRDWIDSTFVGVGSTMDDFKSTRALETQKEK